MAWTRPHSARCLQPPAVRDETSGDDETKKEPVVFSSPTPCCPVHHGHSHIVGNCRLLPGSRSGRDTSGTRPIRESVFRPRRSGWMRVMRRCVDAFVGVHGMCTGRDGRGGTYGRIYGRIVSVWAPDRFRRDVNRRPRPRNTL